jgi:hypothetical protein
MVYDWVYRIKSQNREGLQYTAILRPLLAQMGKMLVKSEDLGVSKFEASA